MTGLPVGTRVVLAEDVDLDNPSVGTVVHPTAIEIGQCRSECGLYEATLMALIAWPTQRRWEYIEDLTERT